MTDYLSLVKNIQTLIFSYQDVSTIYSKLEAQGHLEKLVSLLVDVYSEEHEFTLNELRKYGRDSNQREEDFLEEQYELNSTIFRRNFSLIVQNIADEIGRSFLNKFKKEYQINGKKHGLAIRVEHEFLDDHPNPKFGNVQKPQYKSDMPEIQEETESTGKISPLKSSAAKTHRAENEFVSSSARSFELNIEELSQKSRIPHDPSTPWTNYRDDHSSHRSTETFSRYEIPSANGISPISVVKKKESSKQALTRMVGDHHQQHYTQPVAEPRQTKESQRSIEVSIEAQQNAAAMGVYPRSYSQERVSNPVSASSRGQSPSNKIGKSPTNSAMSSRYSVPQEPPLDSEFVHTKGATFSKAERTGFFNQINVPGPGHYDPDDALKVVKKRSPVSSFPRSPKFSVFDKSSTESPGAIYNPSHHFLSK